ncbi:hypothetical protein C8Z91_25325 [Paenibacillus elgii]|uniref:WW domain-containing protein n=1 Tax=Paenibacillus elgii TaxID=189691 RepID=A0A2T6FXR0_9BACL|nr:hypothetical protein [Paenibacillus elgii]PUA36698.1 hypothetical protein C8Z91_25325 [Paenibacillus elgii]
MRNKSTLAFLLGIGLSLAAAVHGYASEYADTPTEPADAVRIPRTLSLLQDTPYYVIPNALVNKAEGAFSPQTVEVIEAETRWAEMPNWWKIRTTFGDRWIKTEPGNIDVPPPSKITLMENTPIYAKSGTQLQPSAVLSPQQVEVVGAEKQWFYSPKHDENELKWLKIRTSWLGDQWIRLPLKQIGSYYSHTKKKYYGTAEFSSVPLWNHSVDSSASRRQIRDQIFTETGEFQTPLGSFYQVETPDGTSWTHYPGEFVAEANETITRRQSAPLYPSPSPYSGKPNVAAPQSLTVFEKIEATPVRSSEGTWYHVRANEGKGWFNPKYADPEDAKPDNTEIDLQSDKTWLYQYPDSTQLLNYGVLGPQKIHTSSAWTAPNGVRWFQIPTFLGNAWINLNPTRDRLQLPGREQDMQISGEISHKGAIYKTDNTLTFGDKKVGYERDSELFFHSGVVAKMYQYTVSGPDQENVWTFAHPSGYSFRIKTGEKKAVISWKSEPRRSVILSAAPVASTDQEAPDLRIDEMRTLLGASTEVMPNHSSVYLSSAEYTLGAFNPPTEVKGNLLQLSALCYDAGSPQPNEVGNRLKIYVYDRSSDALSDSYASAAVASEELLFSFDMYRALYDLSLKKPLQPGVNRLTAVFKVGERIIFEQDFDVTAR